ncbi:FUSC family protein [Arboricoccus pini]|uniref:FUSC family protein n=1 Tax=Arboricoccus pini TaxID=1963835 RepID=UPI0013FDAD52|nr:FUSC family protein [Arboricoccus pini]
MSVVRQLAVGSPGRWQGILRALLTTAAALIAYVPTQTLGLQEGFWAAITAIAVTQGEWRLTRTTARDQLLGAAIGGLVALAMVLAVGRHLWSYGLAVGVAAVCCALVRLPAAGRLSGITATIVLLVPSGIYSAGDIAFWRVSEVAWGVIVAVSLVWIVERFREWVGGGRGTLR